MTRPRAATGGGSGLQTDVALAHNGCHQCTVGSNSPRLSFQDEATLPGVEWKMRHRPADRGDRPRGVGRTEPAQQELCCIHCGARRGFKKLEFRQIGDANRAQSQKRVREIGAPYLGDFEIRS